jgi:hypothetical protein
MDQIHLSPLVDQIQLALGHISNTRHPWDTVTGDLALGSSDVQQGERRG